MLCGDKKPGSKVYNIKHNNKKKKCHISGICRNIVFLKDWAAHTHKHSPCCTKNRDREKTWCRCNSKTTVDLETLAEAAKTFKKHLKHDDWQSVSNINKKRHLDIKDKIDRTKQRNYRNVRNVVILEWSALTRSYYTTVRHNFFTFSFFTCRSSDEALKS